MTLCVANSGMPGGTGAKISSVVISGQGLIHFIELAQLTGGKDGVRRLGMELLGNRNVLSPLLHIPIHIPPSLLFPPSHCFTLAGTGPGGRMDSLPFCPSAKSNLQAHYSE